VHYEALKIIFTMEISALDPLFKGNWSAPKNNDSGMFQGFGVQSLQVEFGRKAILT
jgi:hypothetical protein